MWAILKNKDHPVRYPAELITGTLHIFGMLVFLIAEVYEGQLKRIYPRMIRSEWKAIVGGI
jgi:hypothetical protein